MAAFPPGSDVIGLGEAAQKRFISIYGQILRLLNILTSFDKFAGNEILTPRQHQDYTGRYNDLYNTYKQAREAEKEPINEDVVFEIELIKQVEINVDYILMLVANHREEHGDSNDREHRTEVSRAVKASPSLRNRHDLIEHFV